MEEYKVIIGLGILAVQLILYLVGFYEWQLMGHVGIEEEKEGEITINIEKTPKWGRIIVSAIITAFIIWIVW